MQFWGNTEHETGLHARHTVHWKGTKAYNYEYSKTPKKANHIKNTNSFRPPNPSTTSQGRHWRVVWSVMIWSFRVSVWKIRRVHNSRVTGFALELNIKLRNYCRGFLTPKILSYRVDIGWPYLPHTETCDPRTFVIAVGSRGLNEKYRGDGLGVPVSE